jgi:hypothetical protein
MDNRFRQIVLQESVKEKEDKDKAVREGDSEMILKVEK